MDQVICVKYEIDVCLKKYVSNKSLTRKMVTEIMRCNPQEIFGVSFFIVQNLSKFHHFSAGKLPIGCVLRPLLIISSL